MDDLFSFAFGIADGISGSSRIPCAVGENDVRFVDHIAVADQKTSVRIAIEKTVVSSHCKISSRYSVFICAEK